MTNKPMTQNEEREKRPCEYCGQLTIFFHEKEECDECGGSDIGDDSPTGGFPDPCMYCDGGYHHYMGWFCDERCLRDFVQESVEEYD